MPRPGKLRLQLDGTLGPKLPVAVRGIRPEGTESERRQSLVGECGVRLRSITVGHPIPRTCPVSAHVTLSAATADAASMAER